MPGSFRFFLLLLAVVAIQRVAELGLSMRNIARAKARGGFEVGRGHYSWMVLLHTAFLFAAPLEVWFLSRPFHWGLAIVSLAVLAFATVLRYWAISTLGERWNTRIVVIPNAPAVTAGPYRFFRHPNYLAVVLEFLVLPLVHGAWLTALVFSLLNAALLRVRITSEEKALFETSDYATAFGIRERSSR